MQIGLNIALSRLMRFTLTAFIFMSLFAYVYFANAAVRTVTSLERLREERSVAMMSVSEMESKRMALEHSLTSAKAAELGLVEVSNTRFIVANHLNKQLSLNDN